MGLRIFINQNVYLGQKLSYKLLIFFLMSDKLKMQSVYGCVRILVLPDKRRLSQGSRFQKTC